MKTKFIHYFLPSFLGVYFSYAQVQVETDSLPDLPPPTTSQPSTPSEPALPPTVTNTTTEDADLTVFSPLTDPEELQLIEGLDEPMERLRLRDQDTNMILDMIQLITSRHILRPQNLPAVKVTFDSMSVLTKEKLFWQLKVC